MPETTPSRAEQTVWRRIGRDLLRPSRSQLLVALVLFVVGMSLVTQLRARDADQTYASLRRSDLVQMVDQMGAESTRLTSEINQLERTRQQLLNGADARRVAAAENQKRLDALQILAGTVPATGPGVRLTITDPQGKVGPEILLNTIEELRDAGAEAIQVNGAIRVVASTAFGRSDQGPTVDGVVVTVPMVIEAIGDPHSLDEAARFRGGLVSEVQNDQVGGTVDVEQSDQLQITALHAPSTPQWAKPA